MYHRRHTLATALLVSCSGLSSLLAQALPPADPAADDVAELDRFVVTGRAGVDFRTKAQTSYALTDVSSEQLRLQAPMGVAEAIKNVPGFWVEASGGEASANVRARGIPTDGYSTIALQEDGLPIQHDANLGWMNADQSFRMDETIERMEVVRGGPSSVFASNAPGGVVNFVTRRGGDTPEGLVKYEIGDFGRHRVDAWYGGPAGDWRYGVGGFWRIDDGVRDPGFRANDGYQLRLALGRQFERGRVDFNVKHFDDNVIFYLPIPLTFDGEGDVAAVPGFDANHGTLPGPETAHPTVRDANGSRTLALDDGTDVRLTQATLKFNYDLPGEWRIENGFRYRASETVRTGLFPRTLTAGAARLEALRTQYATAIAAVPGATDVQFRYVTSPDAVFDPAGQNGNGLVLDAWLREISVSLDEVINDFRLLQKFELAGQTHDVAVGLYVAAVDETFRNYSADAFTDVRDNARLLDLVAVDASGNALATLTENGFRAYGSDFAHGSGDSFTTALYASDEWQVTEKLRIDLGARWEKIETDGSVERRAGRDLRGATIADDNVLAGTGIFDGFDRSFDELGWTVGADWQFTPRNGVFARFTPAFRQPSVASFITNATADPITQEIDLYEAGYKFVSRKFDLFATAFYTEYKNWSITDNVFDPVTNTYLERRVYTNTETYGLELETTVRPLSWFDVALNATLQKPEFGDFKYTEIVSGAPVERDYTGNQLLRVPEISFRVIPGVNLLNRRLRVQLPVEYYGDRYADASNSQKLPSYAVLNASIRYDVTPQVTLYANAENLTNEIGLTEGNPRAGQFQSGEAGARFYLARPILGRSFRAAVMYKF